MTRKTAVLILKLAVTAVVLTLLLGSLDWERMRAVAQSLQFGWIAAATVVYFLTTLLESGRIQLAFRHLRLRTWGAYELQAVGLFWATFLPGQIGGDVYRLMVLRNVGGGTARTVAILLALRLIAFSAIVVGLIVGTTLIWPERDKWASVFEDVRWPEFSGLAIGAIVLAGVLAVGAGGYLLLRGFRLRSKARAIDGLATRLAEAVRWMSPGQAAGIFVLSLFVHLNRVFLLYALCASLGISVTMPSMLFVMSLTAIANQLPIGFAGIGTREITMVVLLLPLGVPSEEGTVIALAGRAIFLVFALWGGALFTFSDRSGLQEKDAAES